MNLNFVTDLCSIGTLFAFVLVCAGVLKLNSTPGSPQGKFKTPYINAKWVLPAAIVVGIIFGMQKYPSEFKNYLRNVPELKSVSDILTDLPTKKISKLKQVIAQNDASNLEKANGDLEEYFSNVEPERLNSVFVNLGLSQAETHISGLELLRHKIPLIIFFLVLISLCILGFKYNFSLIPLLGLVSCLYMMAELGIKNWIGFGIWLAIGLIIYFGYSYRNSKLNKKAF
jgi:amino acid transporter